MVGRHHRPMDVKKEVKLLSHVQLFVIPWTVTYQAPLSMGFSRQEYWSGVPLPSPRVPLGTPKPWLVSEVRAVLTNEREVAQSCPTLCDSTDYSLSGSSVHGIFQAIVLEWNASVQFSSFILSCSAQALKCPLSYM